MNVPLFVKFPATVSVPPGAVKLPEMVTALNVVGLVPPIVVVPLNTTVPEL